MEEWEGFDYSYVLFIEHSSELDITQTLDWILVSGAPLYELHNTLSFIFYIHRYNSAFGSPVGRAQGIGYVQELVARLTHTPIPLHNSSTNGTLDDNPITFPLNQSLYVDATHDDVISSSELSLYTYNGLLTVFQKSSQLSISLHLLLPVLSLRRISHETGHLGHHS